MKKAEDMSSGDMKINRIHKSTNLFWNIAMFLCSITCILPLALVYILSFSSEESLMNRGYTFFPESFSLKAYEYFFRMGDQIWRSYGTTIIVTVIGTLFSLAVTALLAYVLSRPDYRFKKQLSFFVLFTMLFNGGLVPSYIVNSTIYHLNDTLLALILPISINAFWVLILRTFYRTIPMEIIESASIDGAGEFTTFVRIVLPLSKPGIATIGLFSMIGYWNDWFLGMLYISNDKLTPIQTLLWRVQNSLEVIQANAALASSPAAAEMLRNTPTDSGRMALTVLVVTPILLAYPFFQRYFVKGLTIGGVKG